jgi:hypothetical protein
LKGLEIDHYLSLYKISAFSIHPNEKRFVFPLFSRKLKSFQKKFNTIQNLKQFCELTDTLFPNTSSNM